MSCTACLILLLPACPCLCCLQRIARPSRYLSSEDYDTTGGPPLPRRCCTQTFSHFLWSLLVPAASISLPRCPYPWCCCLCCHRVQTHLLLRWLVAGAAGDEDSEGEPEVSGHPQPTTTTITTTATATTTTAPTWVLAACV